VDVYLFSITHHDITMKHTRTILLGTSILGLLVFLGAGCGTQSSDSSDSVNSDVALANTNDMANNGELIGDDTNAANAEASSVDTSDWNTYTNEEYGFSFQYPNGTKLDETNNYDYAPNLSFIKDINLNSTAQNAYKSTAVDFAITDLDLENLSKKIEQSDVTPDGYSLAKVGSTQEVVLNQVAAHQGSHATAIGVPVDFFYVPLKNNFALFIYYHKSDKNAVGEHIINTLSIRN